MNSYLYRASLACGAIPLISGIAIFLLWCVTRANVLMVAGVLNIYGGVIVASVRLLLLLLYVVMHWRQKRTWLRALFAISFILVNIPVCMAIIKPVIVNETSYTVTIVNDSDIALDKFTIVGPGLSHTWENIKPGESKKHRSYLAGEGSVDYAAVGGGWEYSGTIDYVHAVFNSLGGEMHLRFTANKEFEGGLESPNWKGPFHERQKIDSTEGDSTPDETRTRY